MGCAQRCALLICIGTFLSNAATGAPLAASLVEYVPFAILDAGANIASFMSDALPISNWVEGVTTAGALALLDTGAVLMVRLRLVGYYTSPVNALLRLHVVSVFLLLLFLLLFFLKLCCFLRNY